ncbi:MAG: type III-A CRISPR-associated protein Cas10/Csm1 [Syntrophorhabdaceae bacterium]|nr:type III-A CRISPR-associated protein Cas10/Csm1 [Syntrophorhabdaceae bacterium]
MSFNEREYKTVVLGALLHDIGKVVQRANDNPTMKKHTEWGYEWLKKHFGDAPAINATIAHHYTKDDDYALNSNIGLIWYQADNLASKERKGKEALEEGAWHSEIAIASPFSRVNKPQEPEKSAPITYLPLITDGIIRSTSNEPHYTKKDYKKLLESFEGDFDSLPAENRSSIDILLMLYEKHFKHVPSITMRIYDGLKKEEIKDKHPDISLYDHSRLTAAIASCMYHYYTDKYRDKWNKNELIEKEILNVPQDEKPYILIGGDISGIQNFIYTITSKGALKSLKGRSFFLELLTEHIIFDLLDMLNLTRCNIIFSGGGRCYILAYNTEKTINVIEKQKKRMNDYLLSEFEGKLFLHLETATFHPDEFKSSSKLWGDLSAKIEQSKKRKWSSNIKDLIAVKMPHKDCLTQYCEVCFSEDKRMIELVRGNDKVFEAVCQACAEQYKLGEALKNISRAKRPVIYRFETEPIDFTVKIDKTYYLVKDEDNLEYSFKPNAVYRINDLTPSNYVHPNSIYFPVGIYQHNSLEELSEASEIFGIKRLAVLRMDVDNLGLIFSKAVPEEHRTFSRMASISRGLNDFFKYNLNIIAAGIEEKGFKEPTDIANREVKKIGRMLTIVYSGGDDLFLVGHWLDITEVAFDIRKYFQDYTGNPYITISGGIAVNHDKYPIYQYARDAEEAEKLAKKQSKNNNGFEKNAITLFNDRVFKWDESINVLNRVSMFTKFLIFKNDYLSLDEKKLPKTFFYRLLALARRFNNDGILILPKAAYLISRARFGTDNAEENLKIKEVIMTSKKEEWKITETATMWILMMTRKGGE